MTTRRYILVFCSLAALLCACIEPPTPPATTNNTPGDMSAQDMSAQDMASPPDQGDDPLDMGTDQAPDMRLEEMGLPDLPGADMGDPGDMGEEMGQDMSDCDPGLINPNNTESGYRICSLKDFDQMRRSEEAFILGQDIALNEDFVPIEQFHGTFDGAGHTISGLELRAELIEERCTNAAEADVYLGAFIDEVVTKADGDSAKIRNVIFEDVSLGALEERLPSSSDEGACAIKLGGIFGRVSGASTSQRAIIEGVEVLGLSALVDGDFGGLAHTVEFATVNDTHLFHDLQRPTIDHMSGNVGGFINRVDASTIRDASFTGKIDTMGTTGMGGAPAINAHFVHTLAGSQLDRVLARGVMSGGAMPISAGLVGQVVDSAEPVTGSSIEHCAVELDINTSSPLIGGLVGIYQTASKELHITRCYVGELVTPPVNKLETTEDNSVVGGLFGLVKNDSADILILTDLYSNVRVTKAGAPTAQYVAACITLGRGSFPETGFSPPGMNTGESVLCDSYPDAESSGIFTDVNGTLRLMAIESFYGARRN